MTGNVAECENPGFNSQYIKSAHVVIQVNKTKNANLKNINGKVGAKELAT